jgi:metallo-beta-lactamase family protein
MKLHFLGANRTTTGSMHLLEINGARVLLECGLYQGRRAESIARNTTFPFDAAKIHALILSHAHIDHSGNIPNLVKNGFKGSIHATRATCDLCDVMLADSAHIQESDAQFVTKLNAKKHLPPAEPLYTREDAAEAMKLFVAHDYARPFYPADGVTVTFRDAGHILGSATVTLDLEERGRKVRLLFTGDVGRGNNAILRDPELVSDVDILLSESTYGDRIHEDSTQCDRRLCDIVNRAIERGGKIIIPAFAVGRTQQLVYALNRLTEENCLPNIPIFVDSPLSSDVTEIFMAHPECFNEDVFEFMQEVDNPFGMEHLTYIRDADESKKLNTLNKPAIIIAPSGMCEAGRIRHHLRNNVADERNTILMVGYCAQHTLGARIIAREPTVNIFGEPHPLRAQVETIEAFSGHADKLELESWLKKLDGPRRKIFLVHGDESQSLPFAAHLQKSFPQATISVPNYKDSVEL